MNDNRMSIGWLKSFSEDFLQICIKGVDILKKLFGGINLTWTKLIIFAVCSGVYTAVIAMLPVVQNTSFRDLVETFEVWILFGIFIIMNSKSAKDSAIKCFVFFLISQPLVYIVQDLINYNNLFMTYYRFWVLWTIACLPMGFIGYYMKKDKWYGVAILTPILMLLGFMLNKYLSETLFYFPRHLLTTIFCVVTLILYPVVIFKDRKLKSIGLIVSSLIVIVMTFFSLQNPIVYSTEILSDSDEYHFDDKYNVYLVNEKYGDVNIRYDESMETYMVHADFKHGGETELVIEEPGGRAKKYNLNIGMNTYTLEKIK